MKPLRRMVLGTLLLLSLAATLGWADDDPPGRVARLQYLSGSVSIQPRGTEDWVEGSLNRPLTTADNIWTDKESRAELSLGTAILRMNSESSLTLTNIGDNTVQVQLHQGTLNLRIRKLYGGEIYEVDTPNLAFTVQKSGVYRFDVGPEGDATLVTVTKGEGDATGDGPAVRVRAHERARFTNGTSLAHEIYPAPAPDGFDGWATARDQRLDRATSARYVSSDTIGYEDLDDYGTWRQVPAYGAVWVPASVGPGWAPYRYGHWVWISPWGWTWVDDAPWGFAPFHYGRWVYYNNYWGWAPGPYYGRPVYAPALVAWFGGSHWGVSFGFGGGYGWCPLGFGEPFFPWYRGSRNYFRNVNIRNTRITNITNITNNYYNVHGPRQPWSGRYANLNSPGGMTAVQQRTIVNSLPVGKAMVPVSAKEFAKARIDGKVDLTPTRDSRLGANSGRPAAIPPQRTFARPVVSRIAPAQTPMRAGRNEEAAINNRGTQPSMGRPTERQPAVSSPGSGRFVPRPGARAETPGDNATPARGGSGSPAMRSADSPAASGRAVPRPPQRNQGGNEGRSDASAPGVSGRRMPESGERGDAPRTLPAMRPVPRPAEGTPPGPNRPAGAGAPEAPRREMPQMERTTPAPRPSPSAEPAREPASGNRPSPPSEQQPRSAPRDPGSQSPGSPRPNLAQRTVPRPAPGSIHSPTATRTVPRPTGRVLPASYRSNENVSRSSGRSSAPSSYGRSQRFYGDSPRYSAPASGRSASRYSSAPSYRNSAPSYRNSAPSYRSSAPSYRGSPQSGRGSSRSSSSRRSGGRS